MCEKKFVTSSETKVHQRNHTGSKPFKCKFCEKEFTQHSYMKSHERSHTGIKPFQCDICQKHFSHKNLNRHKTRPRVYSSIDCSSHRISQWSSIWAT